MIGLPGFFNGGGGGDAIEEGGLKVRFERGPVAADDAVVGDDGLEDAAVVVGTVGVLPGEDDVAALVTDEVFIVGRNQEVFALAETSCAAIVGQVEIAALITLQVDRVAQ